MPPERIANALGLIGMLLFLIAIKAGTVGAATWLHATYPETARRVQRVYTERPWRCYIAGMLNAILGGLLAAGLLNLPPLALLGLALAGLLVTGAILGYAPYYAQLGERLTEGGKDPLSSLLWGALAAEALFMAPVLGQVLSLATAVRGLGAWVLVIILRARVDDTAEPAPAHAAEEDT